MLLFLNRVDKLYNITNTKRRKFLTFCIHIIFSSFSLYIFQGPGYILYFTCDADFLDPFQLASDDVILCIASDGDTGAAYDLGLKRERGHEVHLPWKWTYKWIYTFLCWVCNDGSRTRATLPWSHRIHVDTHGSQNSTARNQNCGWALYHISSLISGYAVTWCDNWLRIIL